MKREAMLSLSAAVLCLFFAPIAAQARPLDTSSKSMNGNISAQKAVAQRMVPAQAMLKNTLDARNARDGQQFQAALNDSVTLKNGQKLPRGTVLVGRIVADQAHPNGNSKLTLRFTQARLKGGKMIPIKAMITGAYSQSDPAAQYGSGWTPSELQIEQLGATHHGVDLHSSVSAKNSGMFVAAKEDDVKLDRGSNLSLAIAPGRNSRANPLVGN
jgi:hypothetical protein